MSGETNDGPDQSIGEPVLTPGRRLEDQSVSSEPRERRPLIERVGLAAVALVLAALFAGVCAASWIGGEPFLAVMAALGSVMTVWVGAVTLRG